MRLAAFRAPDGPPRSAAIVGENSDERVIDLAAASGGRIPVGDVLTLLEAGPDAIAIARDTAATDAGLPLASVDLLAPMARPPKIIASAGNYQEHIEEGDAAAIDKSVTVPKLFMKPSTAVLVPNAALALPTVSRTTDWELELGVVIGIRGRDIPVSRALDHVAGYTIINDISARTIDWGIPGRDATGWDLFFDWLNGKWGDGFAPMGPCIATADEIPDPQALSLRLSVNGQVRQDANTADIIFSCAELIAFASRFMTLEPGDTLATDTSAGVGAASGTYLAAGDVMEAWIEGIGTLVNPVVAAPGA